MKQRYIHPFPARMAPEIALDEMRALPLGSVVLDPMVGSGTTIRTAQLNGHYGFGFDIDPLSVRIARAECSEFDVERLTSIGTRIISDLKKLDKRYLRRYPAHFDDETKDYCDRWFPRYNQTVLTYLAGRIHELSDAEVRNILEVILSGIIVVKQAGASHAIDVAHSRPHFASHLNPKPAEVLFEKRLHKVAAIYESRRRGHMAQAVVKCGDCRRLPIDDRFADMVITSPPYLNALDYMRGHRLSLIWLGYTVQRLRKKRKESIGTENCTEFLSHGAARSDAIVAQYSSDLLRIATEVRRVLRSGATFVCVIGDNSRASLSNATMLIHACHSVGFELVKKRVRAIPAKHRYLPPPTAGTGTSLDARLVKETIVTFRAKSN